MSLVAFIDNDGEAVPNPPYYYVALKALEVIHKFTVRYGEEPEKIYVVCADEDFSRIKLLVGESFKGGVFPFRFYKERAQQ